MTELAVTDKPRLIPLNPVYCLQLGAVHLMNDGRDCGPHSHRPLYYRGRKGDPAEAPGHRVLPPLNPEAMIATIDEQIAKLGAARQALAELVEETS